MVFNITRALQAYVFFAAFSALFTCKTTMVVTMAPKDNSELRYIPEELINITTGKTIIFVEINKRSFISTAAQARGIAFGY
jgi:hypothetical protein